MKTKDEIYSDVIEALEDLDFFARPYVVILKQVGGDKDEAARTVLFLRKMKLEGGF